MNLNHISKSLQDEKEKARMEYKTSPPSNPFSADARRVLGLDLGSTVGGAQSGSIGGCGYAPIAPQERPFQVREGVADIAKEISFLNDVASRLGVRLEPVLSLRPLSETGCPPNPAPTCPLAADLESQREQINIIGEFLLDLLRRLEV